MIGLVNKQIERLVSFYGCRDPAYWAKQMGIRIELHDLHGTGLRGYYLYRKGIPVITVDINLSPLAIEFVSTHELAHHIFDRDVNRIFMDFYTGMVINKFENRADCFAAQALFGEAPMFEEQYRTDWELAECFNTPLCNVNDRAVQLGLYW